MPGFIAQIGKKRAESLIVNPDRRYLNESISAELFTVERKTIKKFLFDKPFYEDKNYILLVEGVILNRLNLESQYNSKTFAEAIICSYITNGETFFNEFRGSFSGLFYDKQKDTWIIYTSHLGDKQVFYSQNNGHLVFGSEMGFIVDYYKNNNFRLTVDLEAAYMVLTYGFLLENHTIANEIKKLDAGHYIKLCGNKFEVIQYHKFNNEPNDNISYSDFIESIDHHFKNAVKLQFDKDVEYNYKHITTLSGGLDSRMTVWIAHELGYTKMLNTTFSQTNYLDETIAKQIATDLKHDFLFKSLDHGEFLKNVDEINQITFGGANYFGLAHGKSFYDLIDFDSFGIMHTGQIGDSIIGTFYEDRKPNLEFANGDGANSQIYIDRLKDYKFQIDYPNQEIFKLYSRAFNGANQGLLIFQEKTESISPFTDVEFLEYCYSIPCELRYKHRIYIDWILKKYPDAAEYPWEKTREIIKPVSEFKTINILGKEIQKGNVMKWLLGAIKRRVPFNPKVLSDQTVASSFDMNPIEYWYKTNHELKAFFTSYYNAHLELIGDDDLRNCCESLFYNYNIGEKSYVLTLLSAIKSITY